jgi:hypothetical protein
MPETFSPESSPGPQENDAAKSVAKLLLEISGSIMA